MHLRLYGKDKIYIKIITSPSVADNSRRCTARRTHSKTQEYNSCAFTDLDAA